MTWFETLMRFRETSPDIVRSGILVDGVHMRSVRNGRVFEFGRLEIPRLAELRNRVSSLTIPAGTLRLSEVVADVQLLHTNSANAGAMFQVASQFNLLEMVAAERTLVTVCLPCPRRGL